MLARLSQWIGALTLIYTSSVGALGLGDLELGSYLNEPLQADVELLSIGKLGEEQIKVLLGSPEDFDRAGVPRDYFLLDLDFEVEIDNDGTGRVLVTTQNKVNEPYLNFLIELRWPAGRLLREYTILLDPVVFSEGYDAPVTEAVAERVAPSSSSASASSSERTAVTEPAADIDYGPRWGDDLAGDELIVQRNDTLWRIAERLQPEGYSVQQTMLALQRLNPEAFLGGNINRLKAGYILRVPDASEIGSRDRSYAVAEVQTQIQDWRDGRDSGPIESAARPQMDATTSADDTSDYTGGDTEGVLEIASGRSSDDPLGDEDLSEELIASYENADMARRDLLDLQSRVAELEERNRNLAQLNELKDDQLKALQDQLAQDPAAEDAGMESALAAAATDSMTEQSGTPDPPTETAPVMTPKAPADRGIFALVMDNLLVLIGVLVALVAGVWLWLRRKNSEDGAAGATRRAPDDDDFADVELGDEGFIVDELTAESMSGSSAVAAAANPDVARDYGAQVEAVDAVAEADIYIAYGRYEQAVSVLQPAIDAHPDNPAFRLKILEVYAAMDDGAAFDAEAERLEALGDSNVNNQVAVLRNSRGSAAVVDQAESDSESVMEADEEFLLDSDDVAADQQEVAEDDAEEILDVDLSLDDEVLDDLDETVDSVSPAEDEGFDLDLDEDFLADLDVDGATAESSKEDAQEYELEVDMEVDEEFDLSSMAAEDATSEYDRAEESAGDELDLELDDLGDLGDLGDEDLALDDSVFDEAEDLSEIAADNELATKLDLARAYIDMGDADGARDILQMVAREGTDEQQQEAQELLSRLD